MLTSDHQRDTLRTLCTFVNNAAFFAIAAVAGTYYLPMAQILHCMFFFFFKSYSDASTILIFPNSFPPMARIIGTSPCAFTSNHSQSEWG